jgi:hypothetical protein
MSNAQEKEISAEAMEELDSGVTGELLSSKVSSFLHGLQNKVQGKDKSETPVVRVQPESETGDESSLKQEPMNLKPAIGIYGSSAQGRISWGDQPPQVSYNPASKQISDAQLAGTLLVADVKGIKELLDKQEVLIASLTSRVKASEDRVSQLISESNTLKNRINISEKRLLELDQSSLLVMEQAARILKDSDSDIVKKTDFNKEINKSSKSIEKVSKQKPLQPTVPTQMGKKTIKRSFAKKSIF